MAVKMKRIGRPMKPTEPGKRVSLGLKVTSEMKDRIDRAAKKSGRTQSQEAELRLELSFLIDPDFASSPKLMAIGRLVPTAFGLAGARAAAERGYPDWEPREWMQDKYCYKSAMVAVLEMLESLAPGAPKGPSLDDPAVQEAWGDKLTSEWKEHYAKDGEGR